MLLTMIMLYRYHFKARYHKSRKVGTSVIWIISLKRPHSNEYLQHAYYCRFMVFIICVFLVLSSVFSKNFFHYFIHLHLQVVIFTLRSCPCGEELLQFTHLHPEPHDKPFSLQPHPFVSQPDLHAHPFSSRSTLCRTVQP